MNSIRNFRLAISDDAILDLHARLDRTRWPDQLDDVGWSYGTELNYLRELVDYWRHAFDWRQAEAAINRFDQYLLAIDGLDTHFIHQRSPHAGAMPLIISHGWPGSIVEFLELIPRLTEPEKYGGRAEDAFHVVAPSLPGYGCSAAATAPGMTPHKIAQRHLELMTALGYERFVAQGGDWGTMVSRATAELAPERCRGLHLNMVLAEPPPAMADPTAGLDEHERQALQDRQRMVTDGFGYYRQQSTRPQTLAYGLNDSPVGLCGWIAEKFQAWTDCEGEIRNAVSWDALLTNISLYWFTGTIGSSVRLYKEHEVAQRQRPGLPYIDVPTGGAIYPCELMRPPRAWAERHYRLVHWFEAERGGHFAAFEQPQVFAADLWRFKQQLR
jgi:microsomal epoxide hydrolase